jgi:predicted nucleotide-binding protein
MPENLFKQINHAVLDLQNAGLQGFERPLKSLARLLRDPSLEPAVTELTQGLDLDAFLEEGASNEGSMVGSATLAWPESDREILGLQYLLLQRFGEDPDALTQFGHTFFYSGSKIIASIHAATREVIIPFARDFEAFVMNRTATGTRGTKRTGSANKVFIVHGHDEGAREMVARYVERLGFEAIILHEQANRGRTIIEKVEGEADVGFAVVLLTPDDTGCVKGGTPAPRARQNVLLELGYFIGLLGRERVCALKRGDLEFPSDFVGTAWVAMDSGTGWKLELARELKAAGYNVDLNLALVWAQQGTGARPRH